MAGAAAVHLLIDLIAERVQRSTWVRFGRENHAILGRVVEVADRSGEGECLCRLAGIGDAAGR